MGLDLIAPCKSRFSFVTRNTSVQNAFNAGSLFDGLYTGLYTCKCGHLNLPRADPRCLASAPPVDRKADLNPQPPEELTHQSFPPTRASAWKLMCSSIKVEMKK